MQVPRDTIEASAASRRHSSRTLLWAAHLELGQQVLDVASPTIRVLYPDSQRKQGTYRVSAVGNHAWKRDRGAPPPDASRQYLVRPTGRACCPPADAGTPAIRDHQDQRHHDRPRASGADPGPLPSTGRTSPCGSSDTRLGVLPTAGKGCGRCGTQGPAAGPTGSPGARCSQVGTRPACHGWTQAAPPSRPTRSPP
jgi:hypothetical protein